MPDSNQPAPDVCIGRSLESKANTPEADEKKKNSNHGEDGETKANTPEADENEDDREDSDTDLDDTIVSTAAKIRTTSGKSEYSQIREENIAKNKELLSQLGLQFGFSRTLKAENTSKKKGTVASSSKIGTKEGHMSKSIPTTSEITAINNNDFNIADKVKDSDALMLTVVGELTENLSTKEPDNRLTLNDSPLSATLHSDTSLNGTMISAKSREHHQALDLDTPASTLTNDLGTRDIPSGSTPHSDIANDLAKPASTLTNDLGTMDIPSGGSACATGLTSNPDQMEVDQKKEEEIRRNVNQEKEEEIRMNVDEEKGDGVDHEKGEEAHTSSSTTNVALVAAPAWLTTLNMDVYLLECSDVKAWQELVQTLYRFEEGNSINGVRIIYYKYITGLTNFLPVEFTNSFTSRRSCDLD